ncbi:MAG: diaminopimelate epimerase [Chloroflexi bacterium]|nr:diaminopimelate epimerase [Chloroflexota bacterium]
MQFVKMHGLGNDFVLLDLFEEPAEASAVDWATLAKEVCDRHFGIGADGLLLLLPGSSADIRMRIFNPDGSEAENCGNGIRCLGRYFHDRHRSELPEIHVETGAGPATIWVHADGLVTVDMGTPIFTPALIPVLAPGSEALDVQVALDGQAIPVSCVSMGNPHAITFVGSDGVGAYPLESVGPLVERHPLFPRRTNFEVCEVVDSHRMRIRVWERGAGLTLACGTGACASVVAAQRRGLVEGVVAVELPGGTLNIEWDGTGSVLMTGPADYVFTGSYSPRASAPASSATIDSLALSGVAS